MTLRTSQTLANWIPALAGWFAALILVSLMRPFPPRVSTLREVLFLYLAALFQVLLVALAASISSLIMWWIVKILRRGKGSERLTWGVASRAVWLIPLYTFSQVNSFWAVVAAVMAVLGLVFVLKNLQPLVVQSPALSSTGRMLGCVVAAAALELGFVAFGGWRMSQAVLLFALAALIVAWQATKAGKHGHPARGLITMFLALVFASGALVSRAGLSAGDGGFLGLLGDTAIEVSLSALQKTFGGDGRPVPLAPDRKEVAKKADAKVSVPGAAHLGIYLWPDVKKETTLVPPLPNLGRMAFGKDHKTPLTIPFYGAYWFFRPPYRQPPFGSLVVHGSPAVRQFLSNDGSPLSEEAHQNLQTSFDLSCCRGIEVDITNADPHPDLVEVELTLVEFSFKRGGMKRQSLGRKQLLTRPGSVALPETLLFEIPPQSRITKMDELIVHFRLVAPRWSESAQVAIERFRLIPKGLR